MLNIVIPMAGRGSRFAVAGYTTPKPLIKINDKPMIQLVTENLTPSIKHRFIFIVLKEHLKKYDLNNLLNDIADDVEIVVIDDVTEGAACTVLKAVDYINNNDGLMIANSDQWIEYNIDKYLNASSSYDGFIMTMSADDPKWSFIRFNNKGKVLEVAEKRVISNEATVGIYNFAKGASFVKAANEMITKELKINNEYYVAPVYNQLIDNNANIGFHNIDGPHNQGMYGLGTPEDLKEFLNSGIVRKL